MRVVINRQTIFGRKSGVGNYTVHLIRNLRRQVTEDELEEFPHHPLALLWKSWPKVCGFLEQFPKSSKVYHGSFSATMSRLRTRGMNGLRRQGRAFASCCFRAAHARRDFDLYHEPNFIPFASDCPTVATFHDLSVLLHPGWHPDDRVAYFQRHFQRGLSQCAHVLVVSDFIRQEVIRQLNVSPERVTRTYNGIRPGLGPLPSEQVATRLRELGLPAQYLLYLGTIEPRKNLLMLLQAYCSLPLVVREQWPLVMVGGWGWKTERIADYFHREARHRGVIHVGYLPSNSLAAVYNGARALVYPSFYEGFGLPPIEMMACGGAVLASTAGALVETLGDRSHLIPPDDSDGWRSALLRVVQDQEWWQSLRQGTRLWASQYSWERCASETLEVYRNVHRGSQSDRILQIRDVHRKRRAA